MDLLRDIPLRTPLDVIVQQVVFSWWGNSGTGVGRNINNIQRAFMAEGCGNRFASVICKYLELTKLAQNDGKLVDGPLTYHRLMIENLIAVPDRAPPRMAFKSWMSELPRDMCKLMRLLSDQIDNQELYMSICDTLAIQYHFEAKLMSMTGFWHDATMNAMVKWLLEDTDMDGMEQLKYLFEAFSVINKQDLFQECLVLMGYSLPEMAKTPSSGHSVHFHTPESESLPPTPPSPLPCTSGSSSDASSPSNCTLDMKPEENGENKEKGEDPSGHKSKMHRLAGQDDLAIIEYGEIRVNGGSHNMADLDSLDDKSIIGCISLRMERAPLKTFKPKEFLESISPKVLLTDINKTQKENGEN